MANDETSDLASAARAARMREQIKQIESGFPESAPTTQEETLPQPTPRDFIQQRMRELDRKK